MSEASVAVAVTSASGSGNSGASSGAPAGANGSAGSKAERAPERSPANPIAGTPPAPAAAPDIERARSQMLGSNEAGAKLRAIDGAGHEQQNSKTERAAPESAPLRINADMPMPAYTPDAEIAAQMKGLREITAVLNAAAGYGVLEIKDREPAAVADASASPKSILNQQSASAKAAPDLTAGPSGPPEDYWFPPGASTTRPNVNRNTSWQNGGAGAPAAEAGTSDRAQRASSTTGPNAEDPASASKARSAGPAANDQPAKNTPPDGYYIPNTAPKADQKTSFEGVNDWVKRDLIEYHKHDPVKGKNFFESMLLIPHNRENAKMQEAVAGSMGDHAFRNAEYAKLLQSARPDIMRNYADEKTRVTAMATETIERQYGDNLQNGGTTGPKSRDEESGLAKAASIKKLGDGREDALTGVRHPYAQGREKASLAEKIRNGAVHATFGIAGGYAINKVIDHYSKPPAATNSSAPNILKSAAEVKPGQNNLSALQPKSGGRKM